MSDTMWTRILLLLVFAALCNTGYGITVDDCFDNLSRDKYLKVFNEKCYYFNMNSRKDFDPAQDYCQDTGGELAAIKTSELNQFVWAALQNFTYRGNVWIGLSDWEHEGVYLWRDGTRMDYENFKRGAGPRSSPWDYSHNQKDCVAIQSSDGEWTDLECEYYLSYQGKPFICEYISKPTLQAKEACPDSVPRTRDLQILDDVCYYFNVSYPQDFPTAKYICEKPGGSLVSIKSEKVEHFVWKLLKEKVSWGTNAWIGLKDENKDRKFLWRDGTVMNYTNFAYPDIISYYGEDCVVMDSSNGKWLDFKCSYDTAVIVCEYPAAKGDNAAREITYERRSFASKTKANISTSDMPTSRFPGGNTACKRSPFLTVIVSLFLVVYYCVDVTNN